MTSKTQSSCNHLVQEHCTQSPCSGSYISKHTQHWFSLLLLASVSPKYFLLAALLLLSVFCFLPDLCIVASSPTTFLDVVAVEFSSVVCVVLCSSALLGFSANLRSFSANLCAFASATFLLSLLSLLQLS